MPETTDTSWDAFVGWAKRFWERPTFDAEERDYKLVLAGMLRDARMAADAGVRERIDQLRGIFTFKDVGGQQNIVRWQDYTPYLDWAEASEAEFLRGLSGLWQPDASAEERIRPFLAALPGEAVKSPSARLTLASFLLLGVDAGRWPPYRFRPFEKAAKLTGTAPTLKADDEAATYRSALAFMDRFLEESRRRGLESRDRLDAQGLVWALTQWWPPSEEWSASDRAEFAKYIGKKLELPPPPKKRVKEDPPRPEGDAETLFTPEPTLQPELPLAEIAEKTGFDLDTLERWVRAIRRKGQAILYGPPGTGKTFAAELLARHLIGGGNGFMNLVQFHPAYAYEDFIQGIRPRTSGGQVTYELVPGRFMDFCRRAAKAGGDSVLIIDEINRANLSRVFGELMYLLEYRDRQVPLAGAQTLRIPKNAFLLGTMNTADRSIALVDHALRRRFAFLHLRPDYEALRSYHQREKTGFDPSGLIEQLRRLNQQINDPHYEVGISFFLHPDVRDHIEDIWRMEILPYLEEYFFDQQAKVAAFAWEKVKEHIAGG